MTRDALLPLADPQIIEVNLTSESAQEIAPGRSYEFTYSIDWVPMTKSFEDRFSRYLDYRSVWCRLPFR